MKKSYEEMIELLHKNEAVPEDIFDKVMFSIQNNHAKRQVKRSTRIMVALSPLLTSVVVVVMFFGINGINTRRVATSNFLLQVYTQGYSDKYILDINEEFLY